MRIKRFYINKFSILGTVGKVGVGMCPPNLVQYDDKRDKYDKRDECNKCDECDKYAECD